MSDDTRLLQLGDEPAQAHFGNGDNDPMIQVSPSKVFNDQGQAGAFAQEPTVSLESLSQQGFQS